MEIATIDPFKDRKQSSTQISLATFPCPTCKIQVHGDRGYYETHSVKVINPYGLPEEHICPSSNSKIKAELRTITFNGTCDKCDLTFDVAVTEAFPGALLTQGLTRIPCLHCDGKTKATCKSCGVSIYQDEQSVWMHSLNNKPECPNQVIDPNATEEIEDSLSEFLTPAVKEPIKAAPLDGSVHKADLNMVLMHDGYAIQIPENTEDDSSDMNH